MGLPRSGRSEEPSGEKSSAWIQDRLSDAEFGKNLANLLRQFTRSANSRFDITYGQAMQQMDAREVLRKDLQNLIGEKPARIGVFHSGVYFYTVMPAVKPLNSGKVTVLLQNAGENVDFFLIGFTAQISPAQLKATVRRIEARGNFSYVKSYNVPVRIFGHEFSLTRFPEDMTYPFPTILLFRARSPALSTS